MTRVEAADIRMRPDSRCWEAPRMPVAEVSPGVSIAYEAFGDPSDAPVLLVMGLGAQMVA